MPYEDEDYYYGCEDDCELCKGVGSIKPAKLFAEAIDCPNSAWRCSHCEGRGFNDSTAVRQHIVVNHPEVD